MALASPRELRLHKHGSSEGCSASPRAASPRPCSQCQCHRGLRTAQGIGTELDPFSSRSQLQWEGGSWEGEWAELFLAGHKE